MTSSCLYFPFHAIFPGTPLKTIAPYLSYIEKLIAVKFNPKGFNLSFTPSELGLKAVGIYIDSSHCSDKTFMINV